MHTQIILQSKGDRYYLDGEVKIKLHTLQRLKKMNSTYPKTSADFDEEFLSILLQAIFGKEALLQCGQHNSLKHFNRPKLQLAKGTYMVLYT